MSRRAKKIMTIVGSVLILLIVVFVGLLLYVDTIARKAIESGGTSALGVQTTLGSASVGVFSGTFSMSRLHIANPPGFKGDHFLNLGDAGVKVSLGTILSEVVQMPTFTMNDLSVRLEKEGFKSNYGVILENLRKMQADSTAASSKPADKGSEKRFVVEEIVLKNINIHAELLDAPGPIGSVVKPASTFEIPISEIRLTGIGKPGPGGAVNGVTMKELSGIIVQAVMDAAMEKGRGILPGEILGDLGKGLGGLKSLSSMGIGTVTGALGSVAGEALKGAGEIGKDAGKVIEQGGKTIEEGIKGLIPGQKKKN